MQNPMGGDVLWVQRTPLPFPQPHSHPISTLFFPMLSSSTVQDTSSATMLRNAKQAVVDTSDMQVQGIIAFCSAFQLGHLRRFQAASV